MCWVGVVCLSVGVSGGCLGAGTGAGSCPAAPFRADPAEIDHKAGCPQWSECCTEYGYCHPKVTTVVRVLHRERILPS